MRFANLKKKKCNQNYSLFFTQSFFEELIRLTNEYVAASVASVSGNTTNLGDTTALMEVTHSLLIFISFVSKC